MTRPTPSRARPIHHIALLVAIAIMVGLGNNRAAAQSVANVLLVVNGASPASEAVAHHYVMRRAVPQDNVCTIQAPITETVSRDVYAYQIEQPIWKCIAAAQGHDRILYIVLTKGVPIRIAGSGGRTGTVASVDSELTLLYRRRAGQEVPIAGFVPNPYFAAGAAPSAIKPFSHQQFDIYLVTRLDGYTEGDAEALIDKGASATSDGRFILDERGSLVDSGGDGWLRAAAERLRAQGLGDRVLLDESTKVVTHESKVLGYYSWGSNDPAIRERHYGMEFVPGALAATFVSTDGRTLKEPPKTWAPANNATKESIYEGSHQSLIGDFIRDGATGVAGHVNEPYLDATIRPDVLFPAYVSGRNLAESFYAAMPYLSWQTIVFGDPLCAPFQKKAMSSDEIDPGFDFSAELPAAFTKRRLATLPATVKRDAAIAYLRYESRLDRKDAAGARQALEAAVIADPLFTVARLQLGDLQLRDGQIDRAIANYEAIVKARPNEILALNNLAFNLATGRDKPKEALPYAERAATLAKNNPLILDTYAWVQHLVGQDREAAATMHQALSFGIANAEMLWHAAVIDVAVNDLRRAALELQAALKLEPALSDRDDIKQLQQQLAPAK